jgi:hypothetical protein
VDRIWNGYIVKIWKPNDIKDKDTATELEEVEEKLPSPDPVPEEVKDRH